ncbi:MAG TPA: mechanosensitive ion channel family protein, partial [Candidatus Paceibacterota bacterium]|nr:mechanosensitive ion channel family protein [Candidatus Paceibacterota bacterium]
ANGFIDVFIAVVALLMVLSEFGIAIGPLLAAAGVAGVAVGFGAQYLIRDLIAGIFMLMENQYRVGDVVCFDAICGQVETLSLRMTTLRDMDGTVHHVPHGEVKTVSNLSKKFSRVNLNLGVSYAADLEKVISVVDEVGAALAADPLWKDKVITAPHFLRVDDFGDSSVVIKIVADTQPIMQWDVTGELRKRLKIAFDKNGIEIPFPQRVIHKGE